MGHPKETANPKIIHHCEKAFLDASDDLIDAVNYAVSRSSTKVSLLKNLFSSGQLIIVTIKYEIHPNHKKFNVAFEIFYQLVKEDNKSSTDMTDKLNELKNAVHRLHHTVVVNPLYKKEITEDIQDAVIALKENISATCNSYEALRDTSTYQPSQRS
ncbi:MAG: hypothetical protein P4M12_06050 [Gammaproteobacteria bacterium]|nr:hypothetical protein [Gammaproteobacteria bacterium]